MRKEDENSILQQFLLTEYFPETKNRLIAAPKEYTLLIEEAENRILNEKAETYQKEKT